MESVDTIVYRVDAADVLVFVNDAWDRFAEANDGASVRSVNVLHRSLWSFIEDDVTREVYRKVLARARRGHRLRFPFQCDAPTVRRFLEMEVHRRPGGEVEFRTRTIRTERRVPVSWGMAPHTPGGAPVRMCAWCEAVQVASAWVGLEEAITRLGLLSHVGSGPVTHGICEPCHDAMLALIGGS